MEDSRAPSDPPTSIPERGPEGASDDPTTPQSLETLVDSAEPPDDLCRNMAREWALSMVADAGWSMKDTSMLLSCFVDGYLAHQEKRLVGLRTPRSGILTRTPAPTVLQTLHETMARFDKVPVEMEPINEEHRRAIRFYLETLQIFNHLCQEYPLEETAGPTVVKGGAE